MNPLSAAIPQQLLVATVFEQRDWDQNPVLSIDQGGSVGTPVARLFQFSDDGYVDDLPFPDRVLMFSIHDYARDVFEMIMLRVEMIEVEEEPPLQLAGPPPPEIRAVRAMPGEQQASEVPRLAIPLPNPTFIRCGACGQKVPASSTKVDDRPRACRAW